MTTGLQGTDNPVGPLNVCLICLLFSSLRISDQHKNGSCKTAVTPLLTHWNCCSFALIIDMYMYYLHTHSWHARFVDIVGCVNDWHLRWNPSHSARFFVTGGTGGCRYDNLWCTKWRKVGIITALRLQYLLSVYIASVIVLSHCTIEMQDLHVVVFSALVTSKYSHRWLSARLQ